MSGLTGIVAVAINASLALKSDGTVWQWNAGPMSPVQVSGLTGIVAIAAGGGQSLALKSNGTVWAWGYNVFGQLGDGTTTYRSIPVRMNGIVGATALAGGALHTLVLGNMEGFFDLNGDGSPDLLWQLKASWWPSWDVVYWQMDWDNHIIRTGGDWLAYPDPNWQVVAQADLNGDGSPDLLWQHQVTGDVVYWLMDGTSHIGGGPLTHASPTYQLVAAADLNGDTHPDLLWQNRVTGDVFYWLMDGTSQIGGRLLTRADPARWLVGAADLNNDGHPDLLWQHQGTGDVWYWLMDGVNHIHKEQFFLTNAYFEWKLILPH